MSRLPVPLAPVAGALALGLALATLVLDVGHGVSASLTMTALLGAAAGGLGVWNHDRLPALAAADAFLAGAVLLGLWGFGALFVFPLMGMVAATLDTPARQPSPRHLLPSRFATEGFAAGPVRRSASVVRVLRGAVANRIPRSDEPESEPLRWTA
jgi:hypothetical protein